MADGAENRRIIWKSTEEAVRPHSKPYTHSMTPLRPELPFLPNVRRLHIGRSPNGGVGRPWSHLLSQNLQLCTEQLLRKKTLTLTDPNLPEKIDQTYQRLAWAWEGTLSLQVSGCPSPGGRAGPLWWGRRSSLQALFPILERGSLPPAVAWPWPSCRPQELEFPRGGRQSIRTGSVGLSKRPALMRRPEGLLGAAGTGLGQA